MDITYIPMARGFVYLAVVLDWFSRRVLSWRLSITMEAAFCVETLQDAMARHRKPEIFNTDQGSQFTGQAFTGCHGSQRQAGDLQHRPGLAVHRSGLHRRACRQRHRDQHGRQGCLAGQRVRRTAIWRSVKYQEVYLRAYDSVSEARTSIGSYLDFYN